MQRYDNLKAIEQPSPRWNLRLMSMLARELDVPILADESISGLHEAFQVIKEEAADIIKVQWRMVGGLHRAKQVMALARSAGIPVLSEGPILSSVGSAATLHLASSIPDEEVAYLAGLTGPLRVKQDITKEPLKYERGEWEVPKKPGLGVDLDEKKMREIMIQAP
jgi:L-alanine-DL-glutamate epimerase-like enolase superfamily enzyme